MTPIRRFGAVDFVLFLYVVLLAGGVRAGYLALCADNAHNSGALIVQDPADEPDLAALVRSVKDANSFTSAAPLSNGPEETAHASPGYPWALGMLARYVPTDQFDPIVRWIQCGLGGLTAGLYYLFARRAFRSLGVGVVAGMLCALHPFWVVDTAALNDGTLASFLVGLVLFTGARAGQTGGPFASLLYGLSLAGMALVRAALLPFAFIGLAWFLLRSRRQPSGWLGALLAFLGFVIGVAPWTIRNWQVYGEPIPIVDSAYLHMWMGNSPRADGGPVAVEEALPADQVKELKEIKKQPERYAAPRPGRLERHAPRPAGRAAALAAIRPRLLFRPALPGAGTSTGGRGRDAAGIRGVQLRSDLRLDGVRRGRVGGAGLALVLWLAGGVDAGRAGDDLDSSAVHPEPRGDAVGSASAARRRVALLRRVRAPLLRAGYPALPAGGGEGGDPAGAVSAVVRSDRRASRTVMAETPEKR